MPGYVIPDHSFDTFAFQDLDHCHRHPYCCFTRWTTYATGFDRARALAEHVVFCERLRSIAGKRIMVLQDFDCVCRK